MNDGCKAEIFLPEILFDYSKSLGIKSFGLFDIRRSLVLKDFCLYAKSMHFLKDSLLQNKFFVLGLFSRAQPAFAFSTFHTKMAFKLVNPLLNILKQLLSEQTTCVKGIILSCSPFVYSNNLIIDDNRGSTLPAESTYRMQQHEFICRYDALLPRKPVLMQLNFPSGFVFWLIVLMMGIAKDLELYILILISYALTRQRQLEQRRQFDLFFKLNHCIIIFQLLLDFAFPILARVPPIFYLIIVFCDSVDSHINIVAQPISLILLFFIKNIMGHSEHDIFGYQNPAAKDIFCWLCFVSEAYRTYALMKLLFSLKAFHSKQFFFADLLLLNNLRHWLALGALLTQLALLPLEILIVIAVALVSHA